MFSDIGHVTKNSHFILFHSDVIIIKNYAIIAILFIFMSEFLVLEQRLAVEKVK